jgi:hypothetical protein
MKRFILFMFKVTLTVFIWSVLTYVAVFLVMWPISWLKIYSWTFPIVMTVGLLTGEATKRILDKIYTFFKILDELTDDNEFNR